MAAITPEEARAFADRWAARRTPVEKKLMQLCALMASRNLFAVDPERERGVLRRHELVRCLADPIHVDRWHCCLDAGACAADARRRRTGVHS
jgi:hypothetical protein